MNALYRVEGPDGWGPYRTTDWQTQSHGDENHPCLWEEPELQRYIYLQSQGKIRFAFQTIDDLYAWFTRDEIVNLVRQGFKIRKIKPRWVRHGEKQSIFMR